MKEEDAELDFLTALIQQLVLMSGRESAVQLLQREFLMIQPFPIAQLSMGQKLQTVFSIPKPSECNLNSSHPYLDTKAANIQPQALLHCENV